MSSYPFTCTCSLALNPSLRSINTGVSNGKRFMAYEIVKQLHAQNKTAVLNKLAGAVTDSDRKRGKLHQVFEPFLDARECRRDAFINQKLNYMHNNPCTGVWNGAKSPINYPHSSALFYETSKQSVYEIVNYKELDDIDLTK